MTVNPGVQYFLAPGFALGGELTLSRTSFDESSTSSYGIGPTVSYYLGSSHQAVHPFISGSALWTRTTREVDDAPTGLESESTDVAWRAGAGLLFMLGDEVGLTGEAFYQYLRIESDGFFGDSVEQNRDVYGIAIGIAAFVF